MAKAQYSLGLCYACGLWETAILHTFVGVGFELSNPVVITHTKGECLRKVISAYNFFCYHLFINCNIQLCTMHPVPSSLFYGVCIYLSTYCYISSTWETTCREILCLMCVFICVFLLGNWEWAFTGRYSGWSALQICQWSSFVWGEIANIDFLLSLMKILFSCHWMWSKKKYSC